MKLKPLFLLILILAVSIAANTNATHAVELKAGLSASGTWYQLYLGGIHYDGPTVTLNIIKVSGDVARGSYSWGKAPNWNINESGTRGFSSLVTREEDIKKIGWKSPSGNNFTFIFDPTKPFIKGECRTNGKISSIELK
jgi:hypothetical protein